MKKPEFLPFELDGIKYRAGRIGAVTQLGISLKLGSVLPVVGHVRDYMKLNPGVKLAELDVGLLGIVGKAMSSLPDESRDFITAKIMGAVHRDETGQGNWLPVWDDQRNELMYDDIDLRTMLLVAAKVFEHNLASFTSALGLNSLEARAA